MGSAQERDANLAKHQIPFSSVRVCFEGPLLARRDRRFEYGEERWIALGLLDGVPVVVNHLGEKGRSR